LIVFVDETVIGPVYFVELVVGVIPSVVGELPLVV
jgi:hypothetical protein